MRFGVLSLWLSIVAYILDFGEFTSCFPSLFSGEFWLLMRKRHFGLCWQGYSLPYCPIFLPFSKLVEHCFRLIKLDTHMIEAVPRAMLLGCSLRNC